MQRSGSSGKDVTSFTVAGFQIDATQDRFSATTSQAVLFEPVCDLALGIFTLLEHTPLNRVSHRCSPPNRTRGSLASRT